MIPVLAQEHVPTKKDPIRFSAFAVNMQGDWPAESISSLSGEGKLLAQTSISVKDGKLELEICGQEPTRLTRIAQEKGKSKAE